MRKVFIIQIFFPLIILNHFYIRLENSILLADKTQILPNNSNKIFPAFF